MSDYDKAKLENLRDLRMHIFVQWATTKGILDDWMNEVIAQSNIDPLNYIVTRMREGSNVIARSISMQRSVKGRGYWVELDNEWLDLYRGEEVQFKLKCITGWGNLS